MSQLPENAQRELRPGESYTPLDPRPQVKESTNRSFVIGTILGLFFAAASTYLTLKLGQGIEFAIPTAMLAVASSATFVLFKRRENETLENVMIMIWGAMAGVMSGGACFVLPAVYILKLQVGIMTMLIPALLGGVLGVMFLSPVRNYFVKEMHGKLPFPEATAALEILLTNIKSGVQGAKFLLYSLSAGMVLDFISSNFRAYADSFNTAALSIFNTFTNKHKAMIGSGNSVAYVGLGFLIGPRYAATMTAGSLFASLLLVPLFGFLSPQYNALSPEQIFRGTPLLAGVRNIGIGGILAASVLSLIQLMPTIIKGIQETIYQLRRGSQAGQTSVRYELDFKPVTVFAVIVAIFLAFIVYFKLAVFGDEDVNWLLSFLCALVVLVVAFLFSAVSSYAIATISVTPISGMTIATLMLAATIVAKILGVTGTTGMLAVVMIGVAVCTCLSMSGTMVTVHKVGYWLGSTPKKINQQAVITAAITGIVVVTMIVAFSGIFGYVDKTPEHQNPLLAPQASAMAAVTTAFMTGDAPWMLYIMGIVIALLMKMVNVSPLAFMLGMYLPTEINVPVLIGALCSYCIDARTKQKSAKLAESLENEVGEQVSKEELEARKTNLIESNVKAHHDIGQQIAAGLIAGGAFAGIIGAFLTDVVSRHAAAINNPNWSLPKIFGDDSQMAVWLGLAVFLGINFVVYKLVMHQPLMLPPATQPDPAADTTLTA